MFYGLVVLFPAAFFDCIVPILRDLYYSGSTLIRILVTGLFSSLTVLNLNSYIAAG